MAFLTNEQMARSQEAQIARKIGELVIITQRQEVHIVELLAQVKELSEALKAAEQQTKTPDMPEYKDRFAQEIADDEEKEKVANGFGD